MALKKRRINYENNKLLKKINDEIEKLVVELKNELKKRNKILVSTKEARKFENKRKFFHLLAMIFPIITIYFSQKTILVIMTFSLPLFVFADYNNLLSYFKYLPNGTILTQLFREHEMIKGRLSGASWMAIGYMFIISCFDKYLASISMSIFIICDAMAALIGKNFGRIKLCDKTLEGTLAFIFSGLIIMSIYFKYVLPIPFYFEFSYLFISLIVSAIVELTAKRIMLW